MFLRPQPSSFGLPNQEQLDSVPYLAQMVKMTKRKRWIAYQTALRTHEFAAAFAKGALYGVIIVVLLGPHLAMIVGNSCSEQPALMEMTTPSDQP